MSRYLITIMAFLAVLSVSGWPQCSKPQAQSSVSDCPTILYTARLLGYVRHSESGPYQEVVTDLLRTQIEKSRKGNHNSILVGMGDNLAPDYGSRFAVDGTPKTRVPKEGKFDFDRDPLATVFSDLGYDALVPEKEDFYFGPEYLRQLGNYLSGPDAKRQVKLLAANLVIRTTPVTPRVPDDVELDYVTHMKGISASLSDPVLPWKRTITVSIDKQIIQSGLTAKLCTATDSPVEIDAGEYSDQSQKGCRILCGEEAENGKYKPTAGQGCEEEWTSPPPSTLNNGPMSYAFVLPGSSERLHLEAGKSYGFCVTGKVPHDLGEKTDVTQKEWMAKGERFCQPFQVERPFFNDASVKDRALQSPNPWFEADRGDQEETHFVVFAVVDPELRNTLSRENAAWRDVGGQHSEIAVIPPEVALSQTMEAYERFQLNHPLKKGQTLIRVLLAQMPPANAEALAAYLNARQGKNPLIHEFKFDLVLSAADERRSNGREIRQIKYDTELTGALTAPLIVPHPIYLTGPGRLVNPLEAVIISSDHGETTYYHEPSMPFPTAAGNSFANACSKSVPSIYDRLKTYSETILQAELRSGQCPKLDALQCLTLESMRSELKADVAILQRWNFFNGCVYRPEGEIGTDIPPEELVESLRRSVWGVSYLARVSITGAKLKNVLDTSMKIANAQQAGTYVSLLHDRDLLYIGVTQKGKTYYVNGDVIEDARIYSIATDDLLAVGNSGYPDISDAGFAPPEIFRDHVADTTVSYVCLAFKAMLGAKYGAGTVNCAGTFAQDQVMAAARPDWPTHDTRSDLHDYQKTVEYARSMFPSDSPFKGVPKTEMSVQDRRIWSVTLQTLAGSFSFSKPNRTDLGVQEVFSGVTNTNVIQAHAEKYLMYDAVRLNSSGAHFNFGVDEQTAFGRSRQGSLSGNKDSVTLTNNTLLVSPFIEANLHRWTPHWKLIFRPLDYLTDLANTQLLLLSAIKTQPYSLTIAPRNNLQIRLGARFEKDPFSFFEFGYIHRDARDVLASLTFNAGTPTAFFCPLNVSQSAGTCALLVKPVPGDVPIQTLQSFQQNGIYWTSTFTIPLPLKLTYVFGTDGVFFVSRPGKDVSPLTKYAVTIDNSLKVPIWGNLALTPHFGIFLFEDQVQYATLTRLVADVQLTYSFDWHQGIHLSDVLKAQTASGQTGATTGQSSSGLPSLPVVLK